MSKPSNLLPVPDAPTLHAMVIGETKTRGRTLPLVMQCGVLSDHALVDYVVKLYGSAEYGDAALGRRHLARELFGALLGQVMGYAIPAVAIISVDPRLADTGVPRDVADRLRNSPGLNFGSRLISNGQMILNFVPDDQVQQAAEVFAFDMLTQNPDRRREKPNMFQNSDGFTLFDHEMAFPYANPSMIIGGVSDPWDLNKFRPQGHVLYNSIKGKVVRFDGFQSKLESVSDDVLGRIAAKIPAEWQTPEINTICSYIARARAGADRLVRSLQEVVA